MTAQRNQNLGNTSMAVVGCGGLGHSAAAYLVGAGIGKIHLIDGDIVEASNLNRQILFTREDVGHPKASRLCKRLQHLNPLTDVIPHQTYVDQDNILRLIAGCEVIIDATDNFAASHTLAQGALHTGASHIYGSIFGWEGMVAWFDPETGPCFSCVHGDNADTQGCEGALIGPSAGVIGSQQAALALAVVTGVSEFIPGALYHFDLRNGTTKTFRQAYDAGVCSHRNRYTSEVSDATIQEPTDFYLDQNIRQKLETLVIAVDHDNPALPPMPETRVVHIPYWNDATILRTSEAAQGNIHITCRTGYLAKIVAARLQNQGITAIAGLPYNH